MKRNDITLYLLKYQTYLYHIAYARLRNRMDVEDAVQETSIRIWMYCEQLERDDAFTQWLTRILINECINIQRRKMRNHEKYFGDNWARLPSEFEEDKILHRIILCEALHSLEGKYRIPIQMLFLSGLSTKEVASRLNISCSAVSGMVRRGREKLRKAMM